MRKVCTTTACSWARTAAVNHSKRGTYDLGSSSFKREALGSDKRVAFRLPCDPALDWMEVFEAPIDIVSFFTMHQAIASNAVVLCGLYQGPLDTYLRENPHLKQIVLCLDANEPRQEATEKFRDKYGQKGYTASTRLPAHGKDWNEYLQQVQGKGGISTEPLPDNIIIQTQNKLKNGGIIS